MRISIDDLKRKIRNKPIVPPIPISPPLPFDLLYTRDVRRLGRWIADFLQVFGEFETELREKLKEAQNSSARFTAVEILEEILGE